MLTTVVASNISYLYLYKGLLPMDGKQSESDSPSLSLLLTYCLWKKVLSKSVDLFFGAMLYIPSVLST